MVTSIKLKGKYNIGINSSSQIDANGTNVTLKDIPFVRYDFGTYTPEDVEYIRKSIEKFKVSTHLIQLKVSSNLLNEIELMKEFVDKTAMYLYFTIDQQDMLNGTIKSEDLAVAQQAVAQINFDRIMIIDNTQNMDMANAKKIIAATAKFLGLKADNIGICNSPLCLNQQLACLTSLKARELATIYNPNTDVALPTANHQCMNNCGCMRFFEVTSDVEAPSDTKVKKQSTKTNKENSNTEKKGKSTNKPKTTPLYSMNGYI